MDSARGLPSRGGDGSFGGERARAGNGGLEIESARGLPSRDGDMDSVLVPLLTSGTSENLALLLELCASELGERSSGGSGRGGGGGAFRASLRRASST